MANRKFYIHLPRKMSALLRVALADLDKTEKLQGYQIVMSQWHTVTMDLACQVCLAGCVLAQHGFPKHKTFHFSHAVAPALRAKLMAINSLRVGDVVDAAHELKLKAPEQYDQFNMEITPYDDPKAFKRDLRRLAARLEKNGL